MVCEKGRIALQAGHASPVKWCLNEKVDFSHFALDASSGSGLTQRSPNRKREGIYRPSEVFVHSTEANVARLVVVASGAHGRK